MHKVEVIALIEDLAPDIGVILLQLSDLLILLGYELLIHCRDLNEQLIVRKIKVRSEEFHRLPIFVSDRETAWFVVPRNSIEIKQEGELAFGVVCELDFVSGRSGGVQGAPTSTTPDNSSSASAEAPTGNS